MAGYAGVGHRRLQADPPAFTGSSQPGQVLTQRCQSALLRSASAPLHALSPQCSHHTFRHVQTILTIDNYGSLLGGGPFTLTGSAANQVGQGPAATYPSTLVVPCPEGWANCDDAVPGCETDLQTSSSHCGACGATCTNHRLCSAGTCTGACEQGECWAVWCRCLCRADGTCVHAGMRFLQPPLLSCQPPCHPVLAAPADWGNCDTSRPDCETDLRTSLSHCGACGAACTNHRLCTAGGCTGACVQGEFRAQGQGIVVL